MPATRDGADFSFKSQRRGHFNILRKNVQPFFSLFPVEAGEGVALAWDRKKKEETRF